MNESLRHRGPDGHGEFAISSMHDPPMAGWLGHRRLRILDLSEQAHQPMQSDDRTVALLYNGEVYNFRELRQELSAQGFRFRSSGDTEVVLRSYEAWGRRLGRLLLARDRTGKKPLFYAARDGLIAFGSEIKALLAAPWISGAVDERRLPEFLTYGYVPWPHTLYEGISQVPPASSLSFDANGISDPTEYWDPLSAEQDLRVGETAGEIARLLQAATMRLGYGLSSRIGTNLARYGQFFLYT